MDAPEIAAELHALVGRLRRRLREEASIGDFTPSQMAALRRLETEGPMTVTRLAQAEGVRPQSMGATVAGLQEAGLVVGSPHPTDGRRTLLSITDEFRATVVAGRAVRTDWLARAIESRFSAEERAVLAQAAVLLQRLADEPKSPSQPA